MESDINIKYVEWLNDPCVNQYLETRFSPQSLESVYLYWKTYQLDKNSPWFAICTLSNEDHIGNIKLGPIDWVHRRAEISLFIGERGCWGKGYAAE